MLSTGGTTVGCNPVEVAGSVLDQTSCGKPSVGSSGEGIEHGLRAGSGIQLEDHSTTYRITVSEISPTRRSTVEVARRVLDQFGRRLKSIDSTRKAVQHSLLASGRIQLEQVSVPGVAAKLRSPVEVPSRVAEQSGERIEPIDPIEGMKNG